MQITENRTIGRRFIVLQQGLVFGGVMIAVSIFLISIIYSVSVLTGRVFEPAIVYPGLIVHLLIAIALFFLAGARSVRVTGKIRSGLLAGLLASLFSSITSTLLRPIVQDSIIRVWDAGGFCRVFAFCPDPSIGITLNGY